MTEVVNNPRLEQLHALLKILAEEIDERPGARDMAQLSRQYRDTLREIEELEGQAAPDEISKLLQKRAKSGKPGKVR